MNPNPTPAAPRSPWRDAMRRFRQNRMAVVGAIVLVLMTIVCVLGVFYARATVTSPGGGEPQPRYSSADNERTVTKSPDKARPEWPGGTFSWKHPLGLHDDGRETHLLGSDELGRDYLARMLYGGAVSLLIGIASALVAA